MHILYVTRHVFKWGMEDTKGGGACRRRCIGGREFYKGRVSIEIGGSMSLGGSTRIGLLWGQG